MKKNKIVNLLITAATIFSFYTGCAPQAKSLKSFEVSETTASHIFGGQNSDLNFQKENGIVGLVMFMENNLGQQAQSICTGTLIDRKVVLTAAHCIAGDGSMQVNRIAVVFINNINTATKENVIFADAVIRHEDFLKDVDFENPQDKTAWNDIALMRLKTEAPADFKTAQIVKPASNNSFSRSAQVMEPASNSAAFKTVLLSGFGISTAIVNKEVKNSISGETKIVQVTEKVESAGVLRHIDGIKVTSVSADQKEILLDQRSKKGACHGDSGGPAFMTTIDSKLIQVGLTSRGTNKLGNCNEGAIYTGLAAHAGWIVTNSAAILAK